MWRVVSQRLSWTSSRRFSTAARRRLAQEDEGDWCYSSEWWKDPGSDAGCTVFSSHSAVGNGLVSVAAYPASRPSSEKWLATERWLQERYGKTHPEIKYHGQFMVLGYQWRVLHFNDTTRQSTVKVMAAYRNCDPEPGSLYLMQQSDCLAVPYAKSMLSVGLSTLASLQYELPNAVHGKKLLRVLCIGHGGGSIPLFVASQIKGAIVHSVEIDPVVINASIKAMGFPASALQLNLTLSSNTEDALLWENIHERLFLYKSDAEKFIQDNANLYDLVFVDAYDGDDIFSHKLWDPDGAFLKALESRVHPEHGTVVVNLHADSDITTPGETDYSHQQSILPMGKYVTQVSRAYKEKLGMAFAVSVPWLCNITVVACKSGKEGHLSGSKDSILNTLISGSNIVEQALDLPFSCLHYIKRNFVLID